MAKDPIPKEDSGLPVPGLDLFPARKTDIDALVELERANMRGLIERYYPGSWDDTHARELLEENFDRIRIARRGDETLGFYAWGKDDETTAWLYSVQLVMAWRGRGLGTWLMACFERDARASGCTAAVLAVHEGNPAKRLYERLGYTVAGDDGPHAWEMRKTLA